MDLAGTKDINFLNFEPIIEPFDLHILKSLNRTGIILNLGNTVVSQKRIVYGFLSMFGDVGGLNDFFAAILAFFFSKQNSQFMKASLIQKLFHFT